MEKPTTIRKFIDRLQFWKKPISSDEAQEAAAEFAKQRAAFWFIAVGYFIYALFERVSRPEEKHWVVLVLGWLVLLYCLGECFSWFWRLRKNRQSLTVLPLLLFILISMLSPGPIAWALRVAALTPGTAVEATQLACEKGGTSRSKVQLWDFQLGYSVNGTKYRKYFTNLSHCPGADKPIVIKVSTVWPAIVNLFNDSRHNQP